MKTFLRFADDACFWNRYFGKTQESAPDEHDSCFPIQSPCLA